MPPPYTSSQRSAIAQFVGFTQSKESVAAKKLELDSTKPHSVSATFAVQTGFLKPVNPEAQFSVEMHWPIVSSISCWKRLFDKYRDDPAQEPDTIGVNGSMRYLGDVGVKLDEVVVLAVLSELSAPTMGELTRTGFVEGWKTHHADTLHKQQSVISNFRRSLPATPDFFKRVYKSTFRLALTPGQKSLALDAAIEYWRLLLQPPSVSWSSDRTPWLEWWIEYLEERGRKGVSKDMWDQTGVFILESLEDESMSWWTEDGAWPGVLDDFVAYVRDKRGEGKGAEVAMDIA
ncbi:Scaffold-type E3 ligase [Lobaria immixta]|nr:Scaffold-type E3 ligase [Lobaria immixta]